MQFASVVGCTDQICRDNGVDASPIAAASATSAAALAKVAAVVVVAVVRIVKEYGLADVNVGL